MIYLASTSNLHGEPGCIWVGEAVSAVVDKMEVILLFTQSDPETRISPHLQLGPVQLMDAPWAARSETAYSSHPFAYYLVVHV